MTDQTQAAADAGLPPLWQALLRAVAQKGLAALATTLTGYGVIAPSQQAQLVSLGLSALLWAASFLWTYEHERMAQARMVAAKNAPPPVAP